MGMLAGMLGGGSAAAGAGTAAETAAAAPAIAGAAAPAVAGAAAPAAAASSPSWMGALQKAGQQRMQNTVSGSGNSASTPSTSGNGLEGLYNVQSSSPASSFSHSIAPVMSPDELLKNRNLSIGGNHGG
jgi:hypothetical protein